MRYLALVAIVFLSGCSPDNTVPGTTVRDSSGVTIVENPKVAPEFDWVLTDVPIMEIGGADLGEEYELYSVRSAE